MKNENLPLSHQGKTHRRRGEVYGTSPTSPTIPTQHESGAPWTDVAPAARAGPIRVGRAEPEKYLGTIAASAFACSSKYVIPTSRYIVVEVVRCSSAWSCFSCTPVELAEAEVAVGDEGAHSEILGDRDRVAIVVVSLVNARRIPMRSDFREQPGGPSPDARGPCARSRGRARGRLEERRERRDQSPVEKQADQSKHDDHGQHGVGNVSDCCDRSREWQGYEAQGNDGEG